MLDRLTAVHPSNACKDIGLTYDDCPSGMSRPCSSSDQDGITDYHAGAYGNITGIDQERCRESIEPEATNMTLDIRRPWRGFAPAAPSATVATVGKA